jgi:hypothetical protein
MSQDQDKTKEQEPEEAGSRRFRFKTSRKESHRVEKTFKERSRHHRSHKSRRSRRRSPSPDRPDPLKPPNLDPDEAFRESLFDALADDEGATYWEGVYGQPIHTYPREKVGKTGELESMNDEDYASFVRDRMWEKSHQHVLEERARRESARKKQREEEENGRKHRSSERLHFDNMVNEALNSGKERKKDQQWKDSWAKYKTKWATLQEFFSNGSTQERHASAIIPWPVQTGLRKDITKEEVESFFRSQPSETLSAILKEERIRWHPDKMQQRFRGNLNAELIQSVTSVFQIVDEIYRSVK